MIKPQQNSTFDIKYFLRHPTVRDGMSFEKRACPPPGGYSRLHSRCGSSIPASRDQNLDISTLENVHRRCPKRCQFERHMLLSCPQSLCIAFTDTALHDRSDQSKQGISALLYVRLIPANCASNESLPFNVLQSRIILLHTERQTCLGQALRRMSTGRRPR